jgi:hypothetical protein
MPLLPLCVLYFTVYDLVLCVSLCLARKRPVSLTTNITYVELVLVPTITLVVLLVGCFSRRKEKVQVPVLG